MYNPTTTISLYRPPVSNTKPDEALTISQIYQRIIGEDGDGESLRKTTHQLRAISDKTERSKFKQTKFSHFSVGGTFSKRAITGLTHPSNLVVIDLDHVGDNDEVEDLKKRMSEDEELNPILLFTSPSGDGLKVIVNIRQEIKGDQDFKKAFYSLQYYIQETYHLEVDSSGKDICRACFLPYDDKAILLEVGVGFNIDKWTPAPPEVKLTPKSSQPITTPQAHQTASSDYDRALIAVEDIENQNIDVTTPREHWMRLGFALATLGESGRGLFHRISRINTSLYNTKETDQQFDSFLRSTGSGIHLESLFAIAREKGVKLRPSTPAKSNSTSKQKETADGPIPQEIGPTETQIETQEESFDEWLIPTSEKDIIRRESELPEALITGYSIPPENQNEKPQKLCLQSGKLTEIAGATGHGKTLFLMNILLNVAKRYPQKKFILLTYEENSDTIIQYLLNIYLNDLNLIDKNKGGTNRTLLKEYFRTGKTDNISQYSQRDFHTRKDLFFKTYIETGRILIKYVESDSPTLCRGIKALHEVPEIGGVFIDYFQYINPDPDKYFPTRQEALKSICIELKDIANQTGLPIVLACQFNQEVVSPTDVLLNKIGEAGDISRIGAECWGLWQMGKDIGRDIKSTSAQSKIEKLKLMVSNLAQDPDPNCPYGTITNPYIKGMYLRVLKSRTSETGSECMFKFRGLTGKIYPNDKDETSIMDDDWNRTITQNTLL